MNTTAHRTCFLAATCLLVTVACGTSEQTTGGDHAREREVSRPSSPAAPVDVTGATLAAYERGMKKEIEAVRAAQQRAAAAQNAQERGEAIQAAFEQATIPLGAAAAGLPVEEYRALRDTINGIFRTLDFQGKIDGPLSMDLSRADAATKARLERDAFADLSPDAAAALRGRMDQLVPVWIEYVSSTAVAG